MDIKIIETPDYILAVSDEKIEDGDCFFCKEDNEIYKCYGRMCGLILTQENSPLGVNPYFCVKIIAHQPKGNAPELELPLLPEMVVEDEVEKLAKIATSKLAYSGPTASRSAECFIWIKGYKAATKVYSEEDLKKMFAYAHQVGMNTLLQIQSPHLLEKQDEHKLRDGFIQSLKQPKTSIWFVAEMKGCDNCINHQGQHLSPDCCHNYKLKTTTINGKEYLVGTYLYE